MPTPPLQFVILLPVTDGQLIPEPRYVGSILDRPEAEDRNARKFSTPADAHAYIESRPALRGATVEAIEMETIA